GPAVPEQTGPFLRFLWSATLEQHENRTSERNGVLAISRFLTLGAGVTPRDGVDAEGSVNPIAGFTFNKVISLV
ncbi:MAG: hypothetical protein WA571_00550, partial [Candidatus Binatus sp.]